MRHLKQVEKVLFLYNFKLSFMLGNDFSWANELSDVYTVQYF